MQDRLLLRRLVAVAFAVQAAYALPMMASYAEANSEPPMATTRLDLWGLQPFPSTTATAASTSSIASVASTQTPSSNQSNQPLIITATHLLLPSSDPASSTSSASVQVGAPSGSPTATDSAAAVVTPSAATGTIPDLLSLTTSTVITEAADQTGIAQVSVNANATAAAPVVSTIRDVHGEAKATITIPGGGAVATGTAARASTVAMVSPTANILDMVGTTAASQTVGAYLLPVIASGL